MTAMPKPSETTETEAPEPHDLGLSHDLPTLLNRRRALGLLSTTGLAAALAACTGGGGTTSTATPAGMPTDGPDGTTPGGGTGEASQADAGESEIPEETSGPFPGDGTNGPNILTETGVVRSDITSSFGESSGTAEGVPLTFTLTVVDVSGAGDAGAPVAGAAVYAWHCDRDGQYSMYDLEDQNYLRGVQETDASGRATFTSVFPGCYPGRWPHIHFEIYPSLDDATRATNRQRTSQLAFPEATCNEIYTTAEGYEESAGNLTDLSLDTDIVFSDGYSLQMAKCSGSVADGYAATLRVPI